MGLDMYLYADAYLGRWNHSPEKERAAATAALVAVGLDDLALDGWGGVTVRVQVGYWRKANQIHTWFVEHVQGGRDDCGFYDVTMEDLADLREACILVLASSELVPDMVARGKRFIADESAVEIVTNEVQAEATPDGLIETILAHIAEAGPRPSGAWRNIMERGEVILDPTVAQEMLPTREGFFFGSTDYHDGYVEDLVNTIEIIEKVQARVEARGVQDFDLYYHSSW